MELTKIHLPALYQDADRNRFRPKFQGEYSAERYEIWRVFSQIQVVNCSNRSNRHGFFLVQDIQDLPDPVAVCERLRAHQAQRRTEFYERDIPALEAAVTAAKKRRRAWVGDAEYRIWLIKDAASRLNVDESVDGHALGDWQYFFQGIYWDFQVVRNLVRHDPTARQMVTLPAHGGGAEVTEAVQNWVWAELRTLEKLVFESAAP